MALLARTLSRYAATIINNPYAWPLDLLNASSPSPLPHRTLYSYTIGSPPANGSVIFLFNRHTRLTGVVKLASRTFTIPYWTMLIIDGATLDVVYDSNTLTHPDYPIPLPNPPSVRALSSYPSGVAWQREPIGISTPQPIITALPIDQLMAANYTTSYVQYAINVSVTQAQVRDGGVLLKLSYANDFVYAWLDEQLVLVSELIDRPTSFLVNVSAVAPGMHQLTFVTDMMGTDNYTRQQHSPAFRRLADHPSPSLTSIDCAHLLCGSCHVVSRQQQAQGAGWWAGAVGQRGPHRWPTPLVPAAWPDRRKPPRSGRARRVDPTDVGSTGTVVGVVSAQR